MNNEAKERLNKVTRKLVDVTFTKACDNTATDHEFQETLNALVHHLLKVRRRSQEMHHESQTA